MRKNLLTALSCYAYAFRRVSCVDTAALNTDAIAVYHFQEVSHSGNDKGFFISLLKTGHEVMLYFDFTATTIRIDAEMKSKFLKSHQPKKKIEKESMKQKKKVRVQFIMHSGPSQSTEYEVAPEFTKDMNPLDVDSRARASNSDVHSFSTEGNFHGSTHASSNDNPKHAEKKSMTEEYGRTYGTLIDFMSLDDLKDKSVAKNRFLQPRNRRQLYHSSNYFGQQLKHDEDSSWSVTEIISDSDRVALQDASPEFLQSNAPTPSEQYIPSVGPSMIDHPLHYHANTKRLQRYLVKVPNSRHAGYFLGGVSIYRDLIKYTNDFKGFDVILKSGKIIKDVGVIGLRYPNLAAQAGIPSWLKNRNIFGQHGSFACIKFAWNLTENTGNIVLEKKNMNLQEDDVYETKRAGTNQIHKNNNLTFLVKTKVNIAQNDFGNHYIHFNTTTSWITLPTNMYRKLVTFVPEHSDSTNNWFTDSDCDKLETIRLSLFKSEESFAVELNNAFIITPDMYTDREDDKCFLRVREGKINNLIVLGTTIVKKLQPSFCYHENYSAVMVIRNLTTQSN